MAWSLRVKPNNTNKATTYVWANSSSSSNTSFTIDGIKYRLDGGFSSRFQPAFDQVVNCRPFIVTLVADGWVDNARVRYADWLGGRWYNAYSTSQVNSFRSYTSSRWDDIMYFGILAEGNLYLYFVNYWNNPRPTSDYVYLDSDSNSGYGGRHAYSGDILTFMNKIKDVAVASQTSSNPSDNVITDYTFMQAYEFVQSATTLNKKDYKTELNTAHNSLVFNYNKTYSDGFEDYNSVKTILGNSRSMIN